jgi:hypothetical protein
MTLCNQVNNYFFIAYLMYGIHYMYVVRMPFGCALQKQFKVEYPYPALEMAVHSRTQKNRGKQFEQDMSCQWHIEI